MDHHLRGRRGKVGFSVKESLGRNPKGERRKVVETGGNSTLETIRDSCRKEKSREW